MEIIRPLHTRHTPYGAYAKAAALRLPLFFIFGIWFYFLLSSTVAW